MDEVQALVAEQVAYYRTHLPSGQMYPLVQPGRRWSEVGDGEQLPDLVDPLQGMGSAVFHRDIGANHQVPDRPRRGARGIAEIFAKPHHGPRAPATKAGTCELDGGSKL